MPAGPGSDLSTDALRRALLPVLDLRGGVVVRGVAGQRAEYRPVVSRLTDSADPMHVADAFRREFGFDEFYVADLDAILEEEPQRDVLKSLARHGRLWVDAAVRDGQRASELLELGVERVVVGLETLPAPACLEWIVDSVDPSRLAFSLDLKGGRLMATPAWPNRPIEIALTAIKAGVSSIIVLDLAAVGVGRGPATLELCRRLGERAPAVELISGGGVRGWDDVRLFADAGVRRVLVASALHNGSLGAAS